MSKQHEIADITLDQFNDIGGAAIDTIDSVSKKWADMFLNRVIETPAIVETIAVLTGAETLSDMKSGDTADDFKAGLAFSLTSNMYSFAGILALQEAQKDIIEILSDNLVFTEFHASLGFTEGNIGGCDEDLSKYIKEFDLQNPDNVAAKMFAEGHAITRYMELGQEYADVTQKELQSQNISLEHFFSKDALIQVTYDGLKQHLEMR